MVVLAALVLGMAPKAKLVSGQSFHAILTTDGAVYGVGYDIYGMQTRPNWEKATVVSPTKMTLPSPVKQVAAGDGVCYALMSDGTVLAWGRNDMAQLGDGEPFKGGFPTTTTPGQVKGLSNIVQIDACGGHAVALRNDGRVFAWGEARDGLRGETPTAASANISMPKLVENLTDIQQVDTGAAHTLALGRDGTVYAWGRNHTGQLGNGKAGDSVPTPSRVAGLAKAIDVAAGDIDSGTSAVVTSDGKVYAWGSNTSGLLGNGIRPGAHDEPGGSNPRPVLVKGISSARSVSLGAGHVAVLHSNGSVSTWGFDGYGQLGVGKSGDYSLKPQKPSLSGVASIYASGYRTFAIKTDGSLWWTGMNIGARRGPMKDNRKAFTKLTLP